jgi:hypothetical protein
MFFTFPDDARWNAERQAVEFGVEIGEYHRVVRVPRRVFHACCRSGLHRALRRGVLSPTDQARKHR